MKTEKITSAFSTFKVNETLLNETKAIKMPKAKMVSEIETIVSEIKSMNSAFSPKEYTTEEKASALIKAYSNFYILYTDLKNKILEEKVAKEEKAARKIKQESEILTEKETEKETEMKKTKKTSKKEPKASSRKVAKVNESASEPKKVGSASERIAVYSVELKEKESIKEPTSEIKKRIASLKRKIARAEKNL